MIRGLDSSFDAPTLDQARAAKAAGVGIWWGYLATVQRAGAFHLAAPWSELAFWNVLQAGLRAGAFVSGWDDPVALRELGGRWGVPLLALDDEDGIRDLSAPGVADWRPPFLGALGGGLYGLRARHNIAAPFHIVARYPGGDPQASWDPDAGPRPPTPCGWQSRGTHTEFGLSVDSGWYDDSFAGAPAVASGGEGSMLLRIPGPAPGTFHLFAVSHGVLVRVSSLSGGLGGVEQWLSQPGNGWVDHGAPPDTTLIAGSLGGGRGLDGKGADRVEVHALASDERVYTIGLNDLGQVVLPWEPLNAPWLDTGPAGPPGPDVRPAVADALEAAVAQLRKAS